MEKTDMSLEKLKKLTKDWLGVSWKNACMDWLHLCLLSIIGNGLVEAVGRTNPYDWQAKMFYRYSTVYLALSILLWVSSFLHQVSQWIAVDKRLSKKLNKILSTIPDEAAEEGQAERLRKFLSSKSDTKKDPVAELRKLLRFGPDWKWQPIAAQTAILFCLWSHLTYPSTDGLASTLLGFLVQAASPWSGLYACRVAFVTLPFLIKKLFDVEHVRTLLRSRKATPGDKRRALPGWNPLKSGILSLQHGRILCCLGCLARPAEMKPPPEKPPGEIPQVTNVGRESSSVESDGVII